MLPGHRVVAEEPHKSGQPDQDHDGCGEAKGDGKAVVRCAHARVQPLADQRRQPEQQPVDVHAPKAQEIAGDGKAGEQDQPEHKRRGLP